MSATKTKPETPRQAKRAALGEAIAARTGQGAIDAKKAAAAAFLAPLLEDYSDSEATSPDYSRIILRQGNRLTGALRDFGTTFNLAPWKAAATAIAEILSRLAWPTLKLSPELEALMTGYLQACLEDPSLKPPPEPSPELRALLLKETLTQPHVWAALREGGNKELAQEIAAMPEAPKKLANHHRDRQDAGRAARGKVKSRNEEEVKRRWEASVAPEYGRCKAIALAMTKGDKGDPSKVPPIPPTPPMPISAKTVGRIVDRLKLREKDRH
jgi:hypothetical protein